MNKIGLKRFLVILLFFIAAASVCQAQRSSGRPEGALFRKSVNTRQVKTREPRAVSNAKKKQEANKKKLDKEFSEYVKASRKRAVKIQSPEVRDRMIQNRKDANRHYKEKRKKEKKKSGYS